MLRTITSRELPAGAGTTMRTGLSGQLWAATGSALRALRLSAAIKALEVLKIWRLDAWKFMLCLRG